MAGLELNLSCLSPCARVPSGHGRSLIYLFYVDLYKDTYLHLSLYR